ncbi:DUF551 domain-containing protein [Raoultella ornithinolytica]|uniref:DUF551 domain-containing protein n=1 Tax=Raoultella ornithinolytica TaxID=54291 RepID=UPI003877B077
MTNNQLTDERLVKILSETQATIMEHNSRCVRGSVEVDARLFESMIMELQERRKAEKDSEPVAYIPKSQINLLKNRVIVEADLSKVQRFDEIPLYRHAQPAVDSDFIPKNLDKALGVLGMAIPESREEFNFQTERWIQRLIDRVIRYADEFQEQPAPVVPPMQHWEELCCQYPDMSIRDAIIRAAWWNHCRAAMLQAGNSPAHSGLRPEQIGVSPAQSHGWIPVSERMPENDVSVLTFDGMFRRVHHAMYGHWQCWEPEKITHWMPLPAAPQEVK